MSEFTFYFTISYDQIRSAMPDVPYMLPASSWSRADLPDPKLPNHVKCTAADCGGFVATFKWGDYRYTPDQYVEWLDTFRPAWAATMDYCCEDEITSGKPGIVRERQQRTSYMARKMWHDYRDASWLWVPTIQGWDVEDYVRHARELRPLLRYMHKKQGEGFRVGIGTLCARASASMVQRVVYAVSRELPGMPLHLWGVKLGVLKSKFAMPQVISVDSSAWNSLWGSGLDEYKRRGMTQRQYYWEVAIPRYQRKVDAALSTAKQLPMMI